MFGDRSKTGALIAAAGVIAAGCRTSAPHLDADPSEIHFGSPRTDAALISRLTQIDDSNGNGTFTAKDGSTFDFTVNNDGRIRVERITADEIGAVTTSLQVCFANDSIYCADQMITTNSAGTEFSTHVLPDTTQPELDHMAELILSSDLPRLDAKR